MSFIYNMFDTWTDSGTSYSAIKMNVTNTASAAGAELVTLQIGGANIFNITKAGRVRLYVDGYDGSRGFDVSTLTSAFTGMRNFAADGVGLALASNNVDQLVISANQPTRVEIAQNASNFGWADVQIFRDAADIWAQRRSTNPQAFKLYNTFTDTSNYERLSIGWSGNLLIMDVAVAGTGAQRSISLRHIDDATGAGTATFAATNCPASTLTAPYTWIKMVSSDGSTVYLPAWK